MAVIKRLGKAWDKRSPGSVDLAGKIVAPPEELAKRVMFSCHMCGQCILHSTGLVCPMTCPKDLRNGPCGGVGQDDSCEVDRSKQCTWVRAVHRAGRLPWTEELYQRNPIVDWQLQGTSSWINNLTGRDHHQRTAKPWQQETIINKARRPVRGNSKFEQVLRGGGFAVTCEINGEDSASIGPLLSHSHELIGVVDAVHVSDNFLASPHMCGLAVAAHLEQQGLETILHMTCRDRNRMMLQSDVLGAASFGVKTILCLTGDHPVLGDQPETKAVFDLDSVNFIRLLRSMRDEKVLESGKRLAVSPQVMIGGAIGPTAPPYDFRPHRLAKKIAAGADFVTSQLIFDMKRFRSYLQVVRDLGLDDYVYIIVGVGALASANMARQINQYTPGVIVPDEIIQRMDQVPEKDQREEGIRICVELIQQLKETPGVSGIDIMDLLPYKWSPTLEIIERAGLSKTDGSGEQRR